MKTKYDFSGIVSLLVLMMLFSIALAPIAVADDDDDIYTPVTDDDEVPTGVTIILGCLVCRVFQLIFYIAAAIAALVIVVAGIKWIGSGDDPSARGAAKSAVVHAIIGLVIVLIAAYLVGYLASAVTGWMLDPAAFVSNDCVCPTS